jgi:hypothetical protein
VDKKVRSINVKAKGHDEVFEMVEEEHGTYLMNSNDLCLIKRLPKLMDVGINAFKIEGRAKSVYYLANVVGVYRRAIDSIMKIRTLEYKSINNAINSGNLAMASEPGIPEKLTRSVDYYNVYLDGTLISQTMQMFFEFNSIAGWSYGEEYTAGVSAHYTSNNESTIAEIDFTCLFNNPVNETDIPLVTALTGNYPNPFNPTTMISYQIADDTNVRLNIYNSKGQFVKTLVDQSVEAGYYQTEWNGKDNSGKDVTSGVYFYRLSTEEYSKAAKMILMK